MGLVVDTITVHVPAGRVCTDSSSSSNYEKTGSVDSSIYRILSKQSNMKTLEYPTRIRSEFDIFLQYAEAKTLGEVNEDFDSLDEYLGSVGISTDTCEGL